MYNKYKEEYLLQLNDRDRYVNLACFDKVLDLKKPAEEWSNKDLDTLLYAMDSISANSIRKYIVIFRDIHDFLCKKENIKCRRLQPTKDVFDYISYDKLRSRIITFEDYKVLRDLLSFNYNGKGYNYRDKVMFELAWEGLANSEIRYLKETDIIWIRDSNQSIAKAILKLNDGREIIVDDNIVVQDLFTAGNEQIYTRVDKNGKVLQYPYRHSQYFIKPIAITDKHKNTNDESVSNPSLMLRQILSKIIREEKYLSRDSKGNQHKLDLENLNLEDIRRSKIIYLLAINKYLSVADIAKLFGKSVECDFYWLKEVSKRVYN